MLASISDWLYEARETSSQKREKYVSRSMERANIADVVDFLSVVPERASVPARP